MPKHSIVDSPALPDLALVHWTQVAVGTLMCILNSRPELKRSFYQVARFVHNLSLAHFKAFDYIIYYLAGAGDLCLIIGYQTSVDRRFFLGFHTNADASDKTMELDFRGFPEIDVLLLARSFVQDQVSAS
jgi:hypothetical protein